MPISTGFISGIVTDAASGKPLEGVQITTDGNAPPVSSGSKGEYLLGDLAGTYTLTAKKAGYKKVGLKITLQSGTTKTKNFSMTRS
ncbi:MAG: carboxypeptidase regulatory-like domain-containing protein [Syntrophobacteraceae bacterium]|nr:carboxypeptidase regulatory-like domain-containing protein [Syntrophobacteraceae bacterium]